MPFVAGFLKRVRRPGRPDIGLPGEGDGGVDPDYGIEEGGGEGIWPGLPDVDPPTPPPGIWPPLTPDHPWRPIPGFPDRPSTGLPPTLPPARPGQGLPPAPGQPLPPTDGGEHPDTGFPPGAIWPPLPPSVHGKYIALVLVAGMPGVKYRYVVIDADAQLPSPPAGGIGGRPPARPTPEG